MTRSLCVLLGLFLACVPVGCENRTGGLDGDQAAILAAADAADGSVDSVVHLCAVCSLAMDGDENFRSHYAGYSFDLCSAHCKETFDYDPEEVLGRLEPEGMQDHTISSRRATPTASSLV